MAALTKDHFVDELRTRFGLSAQGAKDILESILEEIKMKLESGEEVKISGFGKWTVLDKKSRPGRNPYTGKPLEIAARRVVTFYPSEKLREAVNRSEAV